MDSHYETIKIPATAEYVLDIFKDRHRLICDFEESLDPDFVLTMDSTIEDWRNADDLLEWESFGQAMNEDFGIQIQEAEWKAILEPASTRTLRGLCERIAKGAVQEQIKPVNLLGKNCQKGGIFLTIRSKLAQAGASVEHLSPSSELAPFARNYLRVFLEISSKLVPGTFPKVTLHKPLYDFAIKGIFLCWVILLLDGFLGLFFGTNFGIVILVLGAICFLVFHRMTSCAAARPPASVDLGNLKTFRDLVNYISKPQTSKS